MSGGTQENTFWSKVNKIVEEYCEDSIPKCVQEILSSCGFNHPLSLEKISDECLSQIEDHMRKFSQNTIKKFDCTHHGCSIAHYKDQKIFKLLPGHRMLIISMAKCVNQNLQKTVLKTSDAMLLKNIETHPGLSKIMKGMIQTGMDNSQRPKNKFEYTDTIRYFATYVFNMCGRSCYSVLYKNLPLPAFSAVCKYDKKNVRTNERSPTALM